MPQISATIEKEVQEFVDKVSKEKGVRTWKRTPKQRRRQESTRMDLRWYSRRSGNHKNYNRFPASRKSSKSAQNNQRKLEQ